MISKPTTLNQFQGLRAVAFLAIFIAHSGIGDYEALGAWGVSVFFVLSGFLMIYSYLPREETPDNGFRFMLQKMKSLYLLHAICTVIWAMYECYRVYLTGVGIWKLIRDLFLNLTFLHTWIPHPEYYQSLNGPSWYLSVCVLIYILFPLILKAFKRIKNTKVCLAVIAVLFSSQIAISVFSALVGFRARSGWFSTQWIIYYCPVSRLIDFLIGCAVAYLYILSQKNGGVQKKNHYTVAELLIVVFIVIVNIIYIRDITFLSSEYIKYVVLFSPFTALLIYFLANGKGIVSNSLKSRWLVWLGGISPYTFLIHAPVLKYLRLVFINLNIYNNYSIAIIGILLTVISAWIWQVINKRFKKTQGNKIGG